jgi:hypothetical protein
MRRAGQLSAISRQYVRLAWLTLRLIQDCSKTKMCSTKVDLLRLARGWTITRAVVGSAQKRAALDNATWRLTAG